MKEVGGVPLNNHELWELESAAGRIDFGDGYPSPANIWKLLGALQQDAKRYRGSLEAVMRETLLCNSVDNRLAPEQLAESVVQIERVLRAVSSVMPRHAPPREGRWPELVFKEFIHVAARIYKEHGLTPTANNAGDKFVDFVQQFYPEATQDAIKRIIKPRRGK